MATIPVIAYLNPAASVYEGKVSCDSSISNTWSVIINGTGPNGERVASKYVVVDNTGNNGIVRVNFGPFSYSVSPYTRKNFELLDDQVQIGFNISVGILVLTFSNVPLGIPDEVNQYAASTTSGTIFGTGFNPLDKNANITLSNSNFTAAIVTPGVAWAGVRSVGAHATGKFYLEGSCPLSNDGTVIGFAVAVATITANAMDTSNQAAGAYRQFTRGNSYPVGGITFPQSIYPNWKMAIDLGAKKIWYAAQGQTGWNAGTGDPTSGTAGIDISALVAQGALYLCCYLISDGPMTFNCGLSPANDSIPVGYALGW